MKNYTCMGFEEMEEFVLENAILISRCQENNKNVFVYLDKGTFYKVVSHPGTKNFESITATNNSGDLTDYFTKGEARNLFFYSICHN